MFKRNGPGRLGTWHAQASNLDVDTPALFLPTRAGFVPSLTLDLLHSCLGEGDAVVLSVPLSFAADVGEAAMEARGGQGLAGFCGLSGTKTAVMVLPEDALAPFPGGKISKKRVVVPTTKGHINITPALFVRLCVSSRADLLAFPTCEPPHAGSAKSQDKAVNGTLQFTDACRLQLGTSEGMLGSVGGGRNAKMREWSATQTKDRAPFGFYLAGLSRISDFAETLSVVSNSAKLLPKEKMVVAQGSWSEDEMAQLISAGVDLICSTVPFEKAAKGVAIVDSSGANDLNLNDVANLGLGKAIDGSCICFTCRNHSRGYIHHLINTGEMLAATLITIHNCHRFVMRVRQIRQLMYNPPV